MGPWWSDATARAGDDDDDDEFTAYAQDEKKHENNIETSTSALLHVDSGTDKSKSHYFKSVFSD